MKISLFGISKKTKKQTVASIETNNFLELIKSDSCGGRILEYREKYDQIKSVHGHYAHWDDIKNVCVASEYLKKATGERAFRCYNGLVALEVESLSNRIEIDKVKCQSALLPQTLAAFEGADGRSVVILARTSLPNNELPKTEEQAQLFHEEAYRVAVVCYSPTLSYEISIKQPLLEATFKMTVDANPYVNPNAVPFIIEQPKASVSMNDFVTNKLPDNPVSRLKLGAESIITTQQIFDACMRKAFDIIHEKKEEYTKSDEITIIAKVCASGGLPEEETTQRLLWWYYQENPVGVRDIVRTVYSEDENLGYTSYMSKKQIVAIQLREFLKRRYDIRHNSVLDVTEYRIRHSFDFRYHVLSKRDRNTIRYEASLEGIEAFDSEINGLIDSNYTPTFNPIEEYLNSTGDWDGRDRITEVANLVPCDNKYWPRLFYRWFLSTVAHWLGYDPEHGNSTAPILIGKQGYRKSTFCRILLPPELRNFFTDSIDFRTKVEAERMLGRFLLINIDEFDQLSDTQMAFIKHLFQKPNSNIREMYSSTISSRRRYASFIGTSNHQDVLRDPTGNRRFMCIVVTAPIKVESAIDYKQLYAQAVKMIQNGERYWVNDEDEALIKEMNMEFEVESPLELIINDIIRVPEPGEECERLHPLAIMEMARKHPLFNKKEMGSIKNLGKTLTKMKFFKKRESGGWEYYVVRK